MQKYKRLQHRSPVKAKKHHNPFLFIIFLIVFGIFLLSLNNNNSLPTLSLLKPNKTIVFAYANEAQTLDPALAKDPYSAQIISCIFEGLVRFKPGTTVIEPALASKWNISPDGLEYTFILRKNIKFHDGSPFNAEAVRYSIERQVSDEQQSYYTAQVYSCLKEIQIVDDYTVKLILNKPYAPLLKNLAMPFAAPIVSPKADKKFDSLFGVNPVGTGPYIFEEWDKGNSITLVTNQSYWEQGPQIEKLIFKVIPRAGDRLAGLIKGDIHLANGFSLQHMEMLKQKNVPVVSSIGTDISYLGFFVNKKPFNNPEMRQAVSMALNRSLLAENGHPDVPLANTMLPPGVLEFNRELKPLLYDIDTAKKLKKEAGYPNSTNIDLLTYQEQRPYNSIGGQMLAQSIKKELAKININVNIKVYSWEEYKKALYQQEGNAFLFGWISDSGDPDDFLYNQFNGNSSKNGLNITHYNNPQVSVLLDKARETTEKPLRKQLYTRVQQILLQDAPYVPLNHSLHIVGISSTIRGCIVQRNGCCFLNKLY